jgi:hypothetical protein
MAPATAALLPLPLLLLALAPPATAAVTTTLRWTSPTGYLGTRDVKVTDDLFAHWDPNLNYEAFNLGYVRVDGDPHDVAGLFRWTLAGIPNGAVVTGVDITFTVDDTAGSFELYEVRRPWVESQVTWRQASTGAPWDLATAGAGDRGATVLGTFSASSGTPPFPATFSLNAAGIAVVQGWVNSPASNHGLLLFDPADGDGTGINSSEHATATTRPRLTVRYTLSGTPGVIEFQNGVFPGAAYAGCEDAIVGNGTNLNQNGNGLEVDGWESDSAVAIKWDVSSIPPWSTINAVAFETFTTEATTATYPIYELLRDWTETGANWFTYDGTNAWTVPGAGGVGTDRGSTVLGSFRGPTLNATTQSALNRTGVKLVQEWVRGLRPNRGFIIQDYADSTTDGVQFRESGLTNSPGLVITYNEGKLVFTSLPQRLQVGATSAMMVVQRQRADDGVPIAAGAPARSVTFSSSSAGGAFSTQPGGPFTATLNVTIPAGASDSPPVYYRDGSSGSPIITASATTAWVSGTQAVSVSSLLLWDDVESGALLATSGGKWSSQSTGGPATTIGALAAAARRGAFGLRVVDAESGAGTGSEAEVTYAHAPLRSGDYYFRTWFRLSGSNDVGNAQLFQVGNPFAALYLELDPAFRSLSAGGYQSDGTWTGEGGSLEIVPDRWHLLEVHAVGIGTTGAVRRTYLDGALNTSRTGQNWASQAAASLSVGEPWTDDKAFTGTLDFDDLRVTTAPPATLLRVTGPATIPAFSCAPMTVSLHDSAVGALAEAPYDLAVGVSLRGLPGTVFLDSACSRLTSDVSIPAGARQATVYVSPSAIGAGELAASHLDFVEGSGSFTAVTGRPLAVTPAAATVSPGGTQALTASGGAGAGYQWSLLVNRSGATISASGVYTAGPLPVTTDVVQVTDALGATAGAEVNVGRALLVSPARAAVYPSGQLTFTVSGGAGSPRFRMKDSPSGAVVDPVSGVYSAGPGAGVVDVVEVVDARGHTATADVAVLQHGDYRVTLSGPASVNAAATASYTLQLVDGAGVNVGLALPLDAHLEALPGLPPVSAIFTGTSWTTGGTSTAGSSNASGSAPLQLRDVVAERFLLCAKISSDARTEVCTVVTVNPGAAHHARAVAAPATAASCSRGRVDVSVVDQNNNLIPAPYTVRVCPQAGTSAMLVASTLAGEIPSGACLIGDLSANGMASVFALNSTDETVTFTPSQSGLTNAPSTAQITWTGQAPSPAASDLAFWPPADPAVLSTAPGSTISVRLTPRDACGTPISVPASEVAVVVPPPLRSEAPVLAPGLGYLFEVSASACPPDPQLPLPVNGRLSGKTITGAGGAVASINVQVACRPPRFLSQGATTARCGSPYRYSAARVPEVEGDGPLVFSLGGAVPAGMSVTPAGEIVWVPGNDQAGTVQFQLAVAGAAGTDVQDLTVEVQCGETGPGGCGCSGGGAAAAAMPLALLLALLRRRGRG